MHSIAANISILRRVVPENVTIVAVSKTKPPGMIMEAYASGQRDFGENRVQELLAKKDILPADIRWHLIGHLQTNKVKYIASFIAMIESVDSFKLLSTIDREALKAGRKIDCLLQIHIATEETKFGFSIEEIKEMLNDKAFHDLNNVVVRGVMGMATFTDNFDIVRREFRQLRLYFEELRQAYFLNNPYFREISMGMSGDYMTALEEGSTIIRVGSLIFGER
ncbi:MAG: YggS family pyridoxal phosphate-dependent enzyme [Bacteroidales bacterium]|nr:YggS family pyridoxal phosphate-dependent enzyme [Bacteroidales bacterium]